MTTTEKGLGIVVLTLMVFLGTMWMIWDSVRGQSPDSLQAITAPPVVDKSRASIDKSPKMQAERKRIMQGLIDEGYFTEVVQNGTTMPRVWVTPKFTAGESKTAPITFPRNWGLRK